MVISMRARAGVRAARRFLRNTPHSTKEITAVIRETGGRKISDRIAEGR